jgi:hypothetical protein
MDKEFKAGTAFGFGLILIWLTLLTWFIMYGKMVEGRDITQPVLLPPPPLEVIEIEVEGVDYDLQNNI